MSEFDARNDAEWMLETIIDDFAQSLSASNRALFYAQLAELLAQRRESEERLTRTSNHEPDVPPQVQ
jgi:hypothetical protein